MPTPRHGAGVTAFFKLATGRRAPLVNATADFFTQLARKGGTSRWLVVGAAHAGDAGVDFDRKSGGYAPAEVFQLMHREVHPGQAVRRGVARNPRAPHPRRNAPPVPQTHTAAEGVELRHHGS